MVEYFADFHVHTVLSPCGGITMTPLNIIQTAENKGIDILAITDHNSTENLEVILELAKDSKLEIIPGMEVESKEEVHLIALFPDLKSINSFQELIYAHLPFIKNDEEVFGPQLITDRKDEFIARVEKLLLTSVNLSLKKIVKEVRKREGIVFPAHIDKKNYSILTNLGFIPPEMDFSVLEVSKGTSCREICREFPLLKPYQLIKSSDAHYLNELTPNLKLKLANPTLAEIILAFNQKAGRKVNILKD